MARELGLPGFVRSLKYLESGVTHRPIGKDSFIGFNPEGVPTSMNRW